MGTSRGKPSFGGMTPERARGIREKGERAAAITDAALSFALPVLPNGAAKAPIYFGAKFLWGFCRDVQKDGFEKAAKNSLVNYAKSEAIGFVASEVSTGIWNNYVESKIPSNVNPQLKGFAEQALHQTVNEVFTQGADAFDRFREKDA